MQKYVYIMITESLVLGNVYCVRVMEHPLDRPHSVLLKDGHYNTSNPLEAAQKAWQLRKQGYLLRPGCQGEWAATMNLARSLREVQIGVERHASTVDYWCGKGA